MTEEQRETALKFRPLYLFLEKAVVLMLMEKLEEQRKNAEDQEAKMKAYVERQKILMTHAGEYREMIEQDRKEGLS